MDIKNLWSGRVDGSLPTELRWHQIVENAMEVKNFDQQFVFLGFESDEGVQRNKGRIGAAEAPNVIRSCMGNFPVHHLQKIYDGGNIKCDSQNLEEAQEILMNKLMEVYQKNGKSLVLGGGHEITFPHYWALHRSFPDAKIGIINFDAHFDNRPLNSNIGPTSGTGFSQIADAHDITSLHIGIQRNSNTANLFDYADKKGMQYILAQEFYNNTQKVNETIKTFLETVDLFYLTICMDVFSSAFAPGVSATAYNGMEPNAYFLSQFQTIIHSTKLYAFDIAEVNPRLDIDNRTAKLASSFIFELMMV